jgi:polyphosphate kinase 2 PPK2
LIRKTGVASRVSRVATNKAPMMAQARDRNQMSRALARRSPSVRAALRRTAIIWTAPAGNASDLFTASGLLGCACQDAIQKKPWEGKGELAKDEKPVSSVTIAAGAGGAQSMNVTREPMDRKDYEKALRELQVELCGLQEWVKHKGLRVVVLFEGRDAAGKGGAIKAIPSEAAPRAKVKLPKRSMNGAYDDVASLSGLRFVEDHD